MHPRHEAKFGAYLLVCGGLQEILEDLWTLGRESEDSHVDVPSLVGFFEERIRGFFKNWEEPNGHDAAVWLSVAIGEIASLARLMNPQAGTIWDGYGAALTQKIPKWDFGSHIKELHTIARDLSREFFSDCTLLADRLDITCPCEITCLEFDEGRPPMLFSPPDNLIEALFVFNGREPHFLWYAALPFRFIHEYTAHIFPIDTRYQLFSDGWMLVAASRFLEKLWLAKGNQFPLSETQAYLFSRTLEHELPRASKRGIRIARLFEEIAALEGQPKLFMEATHTLCSLKDRDPRSRLRFTDGFLKNLEKILPTPQGREVVRRSAGKGGDKFVNAVVNLKLT